MRIVFLYVRDGASPGTIFDPSKKATNFYAERIKEEGYFWMLKRMVEVGVVNEVMVVIESARGSGRISYSENNSIHGYVIPDIKELVNLVREGDIIFVRGGFKSWYEILVALHNENYWTVLYAANTGREKWTFWDVVLNDLSGTNTFDPHNRFQFDFHKPINPNIFYPTYTKPEYDVCIGASHVHDKKGQWKTVEALVKYKEIFGTNLTCVLPGSFNRGIHTMEMIQTLNATNISVKKLGMISRSKLNKVYNSSKVFIHLGGGGQGDRGPLEAMRCGTPVIVGNTTRHSKVVYQNTDINFVVREEAKVEEIARTLHYMVRKFSKNLRKEVYNYYEDNAGFEKIVLPEIVELFDVFKKHPKRNIEVLKEKYVETN